MTKKLLVPAIILSTFGMYTLSYALDMRGTLNEPYISLYPILTPGTTDTLDHNALKNIDNAIYRVEIKSFWRRSQEYNGYIVDAARRYNIPNNLIRAIVYVESNGVRSRTGSAGEIGLMQIKYSTAISLKYPGEKWELYRADHNLLIGSKLLSIQKDRYGGDILDVISAYNRGSVFRWKKSERRILSGIKLNTALKYRHVFRLDGPYDRNLYGPYYNEVYIKKVIKMYDLFNRVIVKA